MPNEDVQARAAVERATIETKAIVGKVDKRPAIGPIRYNLEAFGVEVKFDREALLRFEDIKRAGNPNVRDRTSAR